MLIQSLLQHKKNTGVFVNGHTYHVASDLVIRHPNGVPVDVPAADAQKLLANATAWAPWNPNAKPAPKPVAEKPRISLISNTGEVIPPPPVAAEPKAPAPQVETAPAAPVAVVEPPPAPASVVVPEVQDPPIPGKGEEWADPEVKFSLDWLQACAKAYKIKSKSKDKSVLVEKIKAAMYG